MGTFYTDEQIREAIAALESHSPGIWEIMKKMVVSLSLTPRNMLQNNSPSCSHLLAVCPRYLLSSRPQIPLKLRTCC